MTSVPWHLKHTNFEFLILIYKHISYCRNQLEVNSLHNVLAIFLASWHLLARHFPLNKTFPLVFSCFSKSMTIYNVYGTDRMKSQWCPKCHYDRLVIYCWRINAFTSCCCWFIVKRLYKNVDSSSQISVVYKRAIHF